MRSGLLLKLATVVAYQPTSTWHEGLPSHRPRHASPHFHIIRDSETAESAGLTTEIPKARKAIASNVSSLSRPLLKRGLFEQTTMRGQNVRATQDGTQASIINRRSSIDSENIDSVSLSSSVSQFLYIIFAGLILASMCAVLCNFLERGSSLVDADSALGCESYAESCAVDFRTRHIGADVSTSFIEDPPILAIKSPCADQLEQQMCTVWCTANLTRFETRLQFISQALEAHQERMEIHIDDVADMMADLTQLSRHVFLQVAITTWLYNALGVPATVEDCEEKVTNIDSTDIQFAFRARLETCDVLQCRLLKFKDLSESVKELLVASLPQAESMHARLLVERIHDVDTKCVKFGVLLDAVALSSVAIVVGSEYFRELSPDAGVGRCVTLRDIHNPVSLEQQLEYHRIKSARTETQLKDSMLCTQTLRASITNMLRKRAARFEVASDGSVLLAVCRNK